MPSSAPPKTQANMIQLTVIGLTVQLPDFLADEALYCPEPSPCCGSSPTALVLLHDSTRTGAATGKDAPFCSPNPGISALISSLLLLPSPIRRHSHDRSISLKPDVGNREQEHHGSEHIL